MTEHRSINAVAGSFFATLKKELVRDCPSDTRAAARSDVFEYIEALYTRQRAHSLLNYATPEHFDACAKDTQTAQSLTTRPVDRINFTLVDAVRQGAVATEEIQELPTSPSGT